MSIPSQKYDIILLIGGVAEWLRRGPAKTCPAQTGLVGSNPTPSVRRSRREPNKLKGFDRPESVVTFLF